MGGRPRLPKAPTLLNGADLLAHAMASCPDGVVDKPFHDRLGVDAGADPLVPVLP